MESEMEDRTITRMIEKLAFMQIPWFLLWLLVCALFRNKSKLNADSINRIVSIIHSAVIFQFSFRDVFFEVTDWSNPNSQYEDMHLIFSLSYLLYDLVASAYDQILTRECIQHHVITFITLSSIWLTGRGEPLTFLGFLLTEVSNFWMHMRSILSQIRLKHTLIYEYAELLFIFTYILARGIGGPLYLILMYYNMNNTNVVYMLGAVGLLLHSTTTIQKLVYIFQKKVDHNYERQKKGVELYWFEENPQIRELGYYKRWKHMREAF